MDRNMRNNHQMMGGMKRMQSQQPLLQQPHLQMQPPQHRDPVAQQHDELIKYIDEAWHKVMAELPNGAEYYKDQPDPRLLPNFKAFDLDSYWGRRVVQNLHINRSHQ